MNGELKQLILELCRNGRVQRQSQADITTIIITANNISVRMTDRNMRIANKRSLDLTLAQGMHTIYTATAYIDPTQVIGAAAGLVGGLTTMEHDVLDIYRAMYTKHQEHERQKMATDADSINAITLLRRALDQNIKPGR